MLLSIVASALFFNTAFAEIMLFVGDGCSHCATVEKYMVENNINQKLPVSVYEVWHNTSNQSLYMQKAQEVGYQGGGVPLLVDGGYYTVGSDTIIKYFQNLIDKQNAEALKKLQAEAKPVTPLKETIKAQVIPTTNTENSVSATEKSQTETSQEDTAQQETDSAKTESTALETDSAKTESTAFYIIIGFIGAVFIFVLYYYIVKR